ncbi:unnamed protein product [Orchesella dallaii]|uniref:Uncharacterized protein n=1 Tax=Orchesella dallaii TaxID=48710 RepID=A0ABP1PVM1_9HEXA
MIFSDTTLVKWGRTGNDVEPILMRALFPNSTIVNFIMTIGFVRKKLESFNEVYTNNLKVYSLPLDYARHAINSILPRASEYPTNPPWWTANDLIVSDMFIRKHIDQTESDAKAYLKRLAISPNNTNESLAMIPFEYYAQRISKCEYEVFIDSLARVIRMRSELSKTLGVNYENIATSKTPFGTMYEFWELQHCGKIGSSGSTLVTIQQG